MSNKGLLPDFNKKAQRIIIERSKEIFQAKHIGYIKEGRENATIMCYDCENEIFKQETLVIDSQGHFLHAYCYFSEGVTKEIYDRLKAIPEDITDTNDCIDFLIKFYFQHQELTKAQTILSSEEGL